MKKLFSAALGLSLLGFVMVAGCKKEEAPASTPTPELPDTNAPAAQ